MSVLTPGSTGTSTGTGSSPLPANTDITATGAPGLNSSFNPLCNFACPRGFCPNNVCDPTLLATPTQDLPAMASLTPFEDSAGSYVEGNSFLTQSSVNSSLALELMLIGNATSWDDVNCGAVAASGADGDTLGCIAIAVAYLIYGITEGDARVLENLRQVPRSLGDLGAEFHVHPDWKPDGNCTTTRCKLLAGAPEDTWVQVGNGSFHGIHHEIQFMRSGDLTQHAVSQHPHPPSSNSSTAGKLAKRSGIYYPTYPMTQSGINARLLSYNRAHPYESLRETLASSDGQFISTEAIMTGQAVENAVAKSHFHEFCLEYLQEGSIGEMAYLLSIDQGGSIGPDPIEKSHNYQKCIDEQEFKTPCVVWPTDPTDTAEIQKLLDSLGARTSRSVVDSSVLYWAVKLTPKDRLKVNLSKQVIDIPAILYLPNRETN